MNSTSLNAIPMNAIPLNTVLLNNLIFIDIKITKYDSLNVKLSNSQLDKLKSTTKIKLK